MAGRESLATNGKVSRAKKQCCDVGSKGWQAALIVALMCLWVFVSVMTAQFTIGVAMILIFGQEQFNQPIFIAVYSALSYVVAGALIIFVPPALSAKWGRDKKPRRGSDETAADGVARVSTKIAVPNRNDLGLKGWPTWTDLGLAPVGLIVSLLLAAGLVAVFEMFPWFDANQAQDVGFSTYMSGMDRIVAFLTLVVIAPVAEEVIFRGWLYGKVRERLSRMPEWASIAISTLVVSVLFGAVHGQWNVGVTVFCLSVVLCALREVTGTIYAGILTHMLKNGMAFYLLYVLGVA